MSTLESKPPKAKACLPSAPALRQREERLAALNSLSSKLAHDFNNYLVPILGYVTMIKEDADGNPQILHYAAALDTAARQSSALLEQVLFAVRPQRQFRKESTDLALLIQEEVARWQAALPPTAQITVNQRLTPCTLALDRSQWRQVIRELLANAHSAMAAGGVLEISLQGATMDPQLAAELGLVATQAFCLTIKDTGCGMSEETLNQAFDPFFTTRPKGKAKGLGLTLVHNVVRLHQGQVALESSENKGTTVTIWLPVGQAIPDSQEATNTKKAPTQTASRPKGSRILVVDDDPMVREVIKTALQRAGLTVTTANDGREGLELFRKQMQELALIVADVSMPEMSGFEMIREIRATGSAVPVMYVSGATGSLPAEQQVQPDGAKTVLIKKPFDLKGFVEVVMRQLA